MAIVENKKMSPIVALLANLFVLGLLGYILIGQTKKGVMVLVASLVGQLLCCVPGIVVAVLALIDVYQTAQAIEKGEAIDENEYKNETLYKIVKMIHPEAIFKG